MGWKTVFVVGIAAVSALVFLVVENRDKMFGNDSSSNSTSNPTAASLTASTTTTGEVPPTGVSRTPSGTTNAEVPKVPSPSKSGITVATNEEDTSDDSVGLPSLGMESVDLSAEDRVDKKVPKDDTQDSETEDDSEATQTLVPGTKTDSEAIQKLPQEPEAEATPELVQETEAAPEATPKLVQGIEDAPEATPKLVQEPEAASKAPEAQTAESEAASEAAQKLAQETESEKSDSSEDSQVTEEMVAGQIPFNNETLLVDQIDETKDSNETQGESGDESGDESQDESSSSETQTTSNNSLENVYELHEQPTEIPEQGNKTEKATIDDEIPVAQPNASLVDRDDTAKSIESQEEQTEQSQVEDRPLDAQRLNTPSSVKWNMLHPKRSQSTRDYVEPIFKIQCRLQQQNDITNLAKLFQLLLLQGRIPQLPSSLKSAVSLVNKDKLKMAQNPYSLFLACLPVAPVAVCKESAKLFNLANFLVNLGRGNQFESTHYLEMLRLMRKLLLPNDNSTIFQPNDSLPALTDLIDAYSNGTLNDLEVHETGKAAKDFLLQLSNYQVDQEKLEMNENQLKGLYAGQAHI